MDRGEEPRFNGLVRIADHRLEWRDHVANDVFGGVVEEHREAALAIEARALMREGFHQQRVLCDGKDMRAFGLPVPARNPRQTVSYVGDLDIKRGGIKQIKASTREHTLPSAPRVSVSRAIARLARLDIDLDDRNR